MFLPGKLYQHKLQESLTVWYSVDPKNYMIVDECQLGDVILYRRKVSLTESEYPRGYPREWHEILTPPWKPWLRDCSPQEQRFESLRSFHKPIGRPMKHTKLQVGKLYVWEPAATDTAAIKVFNDMSQDAYESHFKLMSPNSVFMCLTDPTSASRGGVDTGDLWLEILGEEHLGWALFFNTDTFREFKPE